MFGNTATDPNANGDLALNGEEQITYHGCPIEIKDRHNRFRAVTDNIWNNPYRATSHKIRGFYHSKD